jgi:hypothetical protein
MKRNNSQKKIISPRLFLCIAAILALACVTAPRASAAGENACATSPQGRQFDFWLGDWDVTYPGAFRASHSKVSLALGECMIVEQWDGGEGHSGENMFAYSADDKSWHGMFVDNEGRVHVFSGKVASGSAEFEGTSRGPNGESVSNRIRVIRLSADKVEQTWEKSSDNGATWGVVFRGEYSRKGS